MTFDEAVALLREAQAQAESVDGLSVALSRRIDAALAAHDAEPVEWTDVEWPFKRSNDCIEIKRAVYQLGLPGANLEVRRARLGRWSWLVTMRGLEDTAEEAKAAALKAARSAR